MSWTKRVIATLFVLAIAGVVAASLRPRQEQPTAVTVAVVQRASITRKVTAAGKLQPATQVKVSSNLSGDLILLDVKEGDHVKKGQLLARIDARRYAAIVQQQTAAKASAEADVNLETVQVAKLSQARDRLARLVAANGASQAELDAANSDVAAEQARLQSAKERVAQATGALADASQQLAYTTLYAPIDGTVTQVAKKVGERVRGSDFTEDVVLVISTLASMEVKVDVGEHEVVYLHDGDKAEVEIDAFPDKRWPATVVEVAKNADIKNPGTEQEVTTFPVRLALTDLVPGALPGMSAEATVSTETHDKALVVPIQAVTVRPESALADAGGPGESVETKIEVAGGKPPRHDGMQKVVFVVEGGKAHVRRVETGLASENQIELIDGVKEGETVVEGPYRTLSKELQDGKAVRVDDKSGKPEARGS